MNRFPSFAVVLAVAFAVVPAVPWGCGGGDEKAVSDAGADSTGVFDSVTDS
ncbi:MAG: hypothetical protein GXP54_13540, partial [Deltaproteobacteria bacterium]|nr:hypothetical protein [Deltaproteobacteria bacterium]